MKETEAPRAGTSYEVQSAQPSGKVRGAGRTLFAAVLLAVAGTLNIIYGIAAIADANFFVGQNHYVFSNLHTWGWITVVLGVIQLTGGFSLLGGGIYGRVVGITAATLGAIGALLSVGGRYPFWSLGIFALCLIVLHGLIVYGDPEVR
jgi:hypothetical protein